MHLGFAADSGEGDRLVGFGGLHTGVGGQAADDFLGILAGAGEHVQTGSRASEGFYYFQAVMSGDLIDVASGFN
jgi:hypothetical protein